MSKEYSYSFSYIVSFPIKEILLLVPEFIYTVDIGLHRGCHDVGVGTKAVVDVAIILNLHVHFTDIVRPLIYSLNCELLESHLLSDNLLERFYSRIDWTIARKSVLKLLSGNIEAYRCYAANALAGSDLEVIETDSVVGRVSAPASMRMSSSVTSFFLSAKTRNFW